MKVHDFEFHDYLDADCYLGEKASRKVCNNTYLRRVNDNDIALTLHGHVIVLWPCAPPAGGHRVVILHSCGYRTPTTKQRINRCLPEGDWVVQKNFEWFLFDGDVGTLQPFVDGVEVCTY